MTQTRAIEPIQTEVRTLADRVQAILVVDQQTFDYASDLLNSVVKRIRRQIAEHHDPLIKSAHDNWKMNLEAKRRLDAPLDDAERVLKGKIGGWLREQEQIRLEAQRALEEEARRKAEQEQWDRAAERLMQGDASESVEADLAQPIVVEQVAKVAPTYEKRSDVVSVTIYSAEVKDFPALVKAAAQNHELLGYLEPNMVALNSTARAQKGTMNIPGVKLLTKTDVRGRAR
ncbi:MAG: hypothetical protein Q8O76_08945 [Chloroflexota bacterium]|nr:hypothetical protein [Chloroflexota bacterium]